MTNQATILKIVKEDILRILGEQKDKKASREFIDSEIKVSDVFLSRAFDLLKKEGLIEFQNSYVLLIEKGEGKAKNIVERHTIIEDYFKKTRGAREAHKVAHLLEHYISEEVINNLRKLLTLREEGILLAKFGLNKKGIICDNTVDDFRLFERTASMGIVPGERIEITHKIPSGLIVKIGNKKFALDENIVKEIKVLEYEKA